MVALLDALDLVLIAAIIVLIAFLTMTKYTFVVLARILDVGILGLHPFGFLVDAIEGTIIAGCNYGIQQLGTAVADLWNGLVWSIQQVINGLENLAGSVHDGVQYLWKHSVPAYVSASLAPVVKSVAAVAHSVSDLANYVHTQVTRLDNKIDGSITALRRLVEGEITTAVGTVERDLHNAIVALKATVEGDITNAIVTAETAASSALSAVAKAENAAIGAVGRAEDATAAQLRDYIASVPLTDLEALLTAVPLLATLVSVTFAESGLDNDICRTKFKGVCGTDTGKWFQFLEGLLVLDAGLHLNDIFKMAQDIAREALPEIRRLVA